MKKLISTFVILTFLLAPLALLAQDKTATPPATSTPSTLAPATTQADAEEGLADYDINYTYDPASRRDPFINLGKGLRVSDEKLPPGAITVATANVVGITRNKDGFVAVIMGTDNKARFMKKGDALYDGAIIEIKDDEVVFRQDLKDDPSGLKSKEVRKKLHPAK